MIGRYKQWNEKEDSRLKEFFFKHIAFFGARWHGNLHNRIMRDLKKWGYDRSEKAVARRCFRLGLKAYSVKKGEAIYKCLDCGKPFITFERYVNREHNKKKYCFECAKRHLKDWDNLHKPEIKQYLKEYNQIYRAKRNEQLKVRRLAIREISQ